MLLPFDLTHTHISITVKQVKGKSYLE